MRSDSFKILFQGRKNRKGNRITIYMRVTINGERMEVTTNAKGFIANWKAAKESFVNEDAHLNAVLIAYKQKAHSIFAELLNTGFPPALEDFRNHWQQKARNPGLLELYAQIIDTKELEQSRDQIGKRSLEAYHRAGEVFVAFLKSEGLKDIPIRKVDIAFAHRFESYLKGCNYAPAYVQKFFVRLRQCVNLAISQGIIESSAALKYEVRKPTPPPPVYLSFDELRSIETADFSRQDLQLQKTADLLIFCCHTGFSYKDAQTFCPAKHLTTQYGKPWIHYPRGKTGTFQDLELFPKAAAILEKYGGKPPKISNQKANFYLKQIAQICRIDKELSTHIGRRTAGTHWLNKGMSYEVVASMLGHTSPEITRRHYARVNHYRMNTEIQTFLHPHL